MTTVVNLKHSPYDVYIGRAGMGKDGYFGNPFVVLPKQTRASALDKYREYFLNRIASDPEFKLRIEGLRGKTLGCFCKPYPCHGDIIKHYLDNLIP